MRSFKTAKLLEEKGFDVYGDGSFNAGIEIFAEYSPSGTFNKCITSKPHQKGYPAPTLQMAMKWMRKEHKLEIYPFHYKEYSRDKWGYDIKKEMPLSVIYKFQMSAIFNSYEESCDEAIQYCLENLI